jgi:hypothetical protein
MVGAVRVAIAVAVLYLVVSVAMRLSRGQWLTFVGPVRVAESVESVARSSGRLEAELTQAHDVLAELRSAGEQLAAQPHAERSDAEATPDGDSPATRRARTALERADAAARRIERVLADHGRVRHEAVRTLHRAGYHVDET